MAAAQQARWAKIKDTADSDQKPAKAKRKLSPAHKLVKALAKARKIRSAKLKVEAGAESKPATKGKRKMSAAGKAAISAAQKARWAAKKGDTTTPTP